MAVRKRVLSEIAYRSVVTLAREKGSATHAGEQREREGLGLHPLVDPSGYGVIRRSLPRFQEEGGVWVLPNGVPMLETTLLDTTGSMGDNVSIALDVLKTGYQLLSGGPNAVLGRYDLQVMTAIFGDVTDKYILKRSQAEMDVEIANQLTYMNPERQGGDTPEDPQYGLFGDAYLTQAAINAYGLKYYHFMVSDAPGRNRVDSKQLVRVFGPTVFEKVHENGHQISEKNLPSTKEIVADLLKNTHVFFLQVDRHKETTDFWYDIFGADHMIVLPRTELLAQVKAVAIGLTEGILDLQSAEDFLRSTQVSREDARSIVRAISDIPIGAQAMLPNFNKIPLAGAQFAKKGDLWPMDESAVPPKKPKTKPGKNDTWL